MRVRRYVAWANTARRETGSPRPRSLNRQGKTLVFPGGRDLTGQLVPVRATHPHLWGFMGELLPAREERGIRLQMAA